MKSNFKQSIIVLSIFILTSFNLVWAQCDIDTEYEEFFMCYTCPDGTTGSGNSFNNMYVESCVDCPAGTYGSNGTCLDCPYGTSQNLAGQASCEYCDAGTYSQGGQAYCYDCPAGTYQDQYGQGYCNNCYSGYIAPGNGYTFCEACPAGTYNSYHGGHSCNDCPAGTYTGNEASLSCNNHNECGEGSTILYLGTSISNTVCCNDADSDTVCDDVDDCVGTFDCLNVCNGSAVIDACNVCNGGNSEGLDCNNDGIDDTCEDEYEVAFAAGVASVTPEDGITQETVDAAVEVAAMESYILGAQSGDINGNGYLNVTDIILYVEKILSE